VEYPFDREGQQLNTDRVAIMMSGITKHFAGVAALDGVDLEIRTGEIRALLGENGAGKTTLMNVLTGLYLAEHGSVTVFGQPMPTGPQAAIEAGISGGSKLQWSNSQRVMGWRSIRWLVSTA
jgi:ABC-type sugar transport system ATPase subunit